MPDDVGGSSPVSLRLPDEVIAAYDRLAKLLDRPRSWIMLRALREYLEIEGAEIERDAASLAELDRGEGGPLEQSLREAETIIRKAEAKHARKK